MSLMNSAVVLPEVVAAVSMDSSSVLVSGMLFRERNGGREGTELTFRIGMSRIEGYAVLACDGGVEGRLHIVY